MADVITRSIPALPYNGGTMQNTQPYQAAVRLTANRMVWTWCQTNPNWRFFSIIDTPEGWANGGNPVVTATRMFDQRSYTGYALQMVRLNDTTFMVFDANTNNSTTYNVEVFEIDANNQITKTYTNLDAYGTVKTIVYGATMTPALSGTGTGARYSNLATFVQLSDNNLMHGFWNGTNMMYGTVVWDPTAKTLTFGTATPAGVTNYSGAVELYQRRVAGSTKRGIFFHSTSGAVWGGAVSMQTGGVVFNADGTSPVAVTAKGSIDLAGGAAPLDCTMMGENRYCRATWNQFYYYKAGTTDGYDGFGTATSVTSNNPMLAYGLDANYLMLIDRTHFVSSASGPLKVKIIRREDSTLTSQSAGSAASATGFSVTAPWLEVWRHESRPQMQDNGDLFWWGLDATGTKLSWNILKNAS